MRADKEGNTAQPSREQMCAGRVEILARRSNGAVAVITSVCICEN